MTASRFDLFINPLFTLDFLYAHSINVFSTPSEVSLNFPCQNCDVITYLLYCSVGGKTLLQHIYIYANCDQGIVNRSVKKRGKRSDEGFRGIIIFIYWPEHGCSSLTEKKTLSWCLSQFWWSNTKEIYWSLKPVSVHYRNKAWIKDIGVHLF